MAVPPQVPANRVTEAPAGALPFTAGVRLNEGDAGTVPDSVGATGAEGVAAAHAWSQVRSAVHLPTVLDTEHVVVKASAFQ